jgi:hypothetical protein
MRRKKRSDGRPAPAYFGGSSAPVLRWITLCRLIMLLYKVILFHSRTNPRLSTVLSSTIFKVGYILLCLYLKFQLQTRYCFKYIYENGKC